MSYLNDAWVASYSAGLPLFVISFGMVYWALKRGYLTEAILANDEHEYDDTDVSNPLYQKWFMFGGGFYGLMAVITYIFVESNEIIGFVMQYPSLAAMIDQISVGAIIKLLIDSIMNLIVAATWFLYWPKQMVMGSGLLWLLVAYLGYRLGVTTARFQFARLNKINVK